MKQQIMFSKFVGKYMMKKHYKPITGKDAEAITYSEDGFGSDDEIYKFLYDLMINQ